MESNKPSSRPLSRPSISRGSVPPEERGADLPLEGSRVLHKRHQTIISPTWGEILKEIDVAVPVTRVVAEKEQDDGQERDSLSTGPKARKKKKKDKDKKRASTQLEQEKKRRSSTLRRSLKRKSHVESHGSSGSDIEEKVEDKSVEAEDDESLQDQRPGYKGKKHAKHKKKTPGKEPTDVDFDSSSDVSEETTTDEKKISDESIPTTHDLLTERSESLSPADEDEEKTTDSTLVTVKSRESEEAEDKDEEAAVDEYGNKIKKHRKKKKKKHRKKGEADDGIPDQAEDDLESRSSDESEVAKKKKKKKKKRKSLKEHDSATSLVDDVDLEAEDDEGGAGAKKRDKKAKKKKTKRKSSVYQTSPDIQSRRESMASRKESIASRKESIASSVYSERTDMAVDDAGQSLSDLESTDDDSRTDMRTGEKRKIRKKMRKKSIKKAGVRGAGTAADDTGESMTGLESKRESQTSTASQETEGDEDDDEIDGKKQKRKILIRRKKKGDGSEMAKRMTEVFGEPGEENVEFFDNIMKSKESAQIDGSYQRKSTGIFQGWDDDKPMQEHRLDHLPDEFERASIHLKRLSKIARGEAEPQEKHEEFKDEAADTSRRESVVKDEDETDEEKHKKAHKKGKGRKVGKHPPIVKHLKMEAKYEYQEYTPHQEDIKLPMITGLQLDKQAKKIDKKGEKLALMKGGLDSGRTSRDAKWDAEVSELLGMPPPTPVSSKDLALERILRMSEYDVKPWEKKGRTNSHQCKMYTEKYGIYDLFQFMISRLLVEKPDNPLDFLIEMARNLNKSKNAGTDIDCQRFSYDYRA